MRLTNTMREAFVRAAMQDVPCVDYGNKIRDAVNKEIAKAKKKAGIAGVDDSRLSENWSTYVRNSDGSAGTSFSARGLLKEERKAIETNPALVAMQDAFGEQEKQHTALRDKLTGAINACATRKQAAEALPEFEKYLPADDPRALRSLPALANVAADFVKAGWPKGQKPAIRKTV